MKKTLIITITSGYLLMMSALGIAASVPNKAIKASKEKEAVRREIIRNIACPAFFTDGAHPTDVRAVVSVDETGKVNIEAINSGNEQLSAYVADQLKNLTLKTQTGPEKFILIVHFVAE